MHPVGVNARLKIVGSERARGSQCVVPGELRPFLVPSLTSANP
jgi:hypothetical protein